LVREELEVSKYLNIPDDLLSLIEKREQEDRRIAERRVEDELATQQALHEERRESQRRSGEPRREGDA
jgi:hypothetical protein